MDNDPETRWMEPITRYKDGMEKMVDLVADHEAFAPIINYVESDSSSILSRFPSDYGQELVGISNISGIELSDIILYNIIFEIYGYCTSIVAQDTNGNLYHGRNLDFGEFPPVNWTDDQWQLTQLLRPILFNANFTKGGKTLYKTVVFAGYIYSVIVYE